MRIIVRAAGAGQQGRMISATGLILLAEAATACSPPGAGRLGGGAIMVRPVGTFDALPFEHLGPAPSVVSRPTDIQHTAVEAGQAKPGEDQKPQPADQCAPAEIPII